MQQQGNLITLIFVIILCLLSMVGCSLIIWTFSKTPKLSKNPGSIILRMSIAQLLITFNLFFAQFYYQQTKISVGFDISDGFCQFLAFIEIFSGSEYILYNVFFAVNLYCSMKKDNYNFQKYFFYMEILSMLVSLCIAIGFLLFSKLSINLAGVCGVEPQQFKGLSIVLATILTCMIVFVVLIMLEKSPFKNSLYNRDQEKFQRKYHHEFKVINLLYITAFMVTYLIPCCLMYWSSLFQKENNVYDFLPLINPLGGILLFVIRINDPIVKKCLYIILSGDKKRNSCKLKDKLIQKKDVTQNYDCSIEPGLEISTCPQNPIRYTIKQVSDKQSSEDSSFKTTFGSGYQQKLIKNSSEILIILLSIKNAMNNCISNNSLLERNQKQLKSHHFLHLTHHELFLQDDPKELELKLRESNNLSLKDFVNPMCYKRIINCYSYASKTLIYWFSQLLNIDINQFKLSLQISQNSKKIFSLKLPSSYGPIMLTYDHYFSIELISKKQKMMLTKGGALMNMCKRYQAEYGKANNGNTLLPAIFGLYTIQLDEDKFVNVVLKLNQLKIEYPLSRFQWNITEEQNQLIQQNVFGWTQLSVKEGVTRLLVAEQLQEGKFMIKIEDSDFKLSNNAAKDLLSILTRDIEALQFVKNPKISLVYFKFPNNRLDSMCNHENSLSFHYQIIKNSQQITPLQMAASLSSLGQFELDGKLGYVRIFFDDLWKAEWESMEDEERYQQFQSLIQQVTEIV